MKRFLAILAIFAAAFVCGQATAQPNKAVKHAGPTPAQLDKKIITSPFHVEHFKFPRGLKKTPRYKLVSSRHFLRDGIKIPSQILMLPKQLSMWGNSQYGDCVSASEAARIAAYSVYCGLPETFIPEATLISWAQKGGYLDGADLTDVMTDRQTRGMADANGKLYVAGAYATVDYSSEPALQAALTIGPVNLGIDADALPSGAGNGNGWFASGGSPGQFSSEDHCVPLFGFGPTAALFAGINATFNVNIQVPPNFPPTAYLIFTWNTVGVVDHTWIMSTVGEAWIQNPTTIGQTPGPTPSPTPSPTPTPTPTPTPPSGSATITIPSTLAPGTYQLDPVGSAVLSPTTVAAIQADLAKKSGAPGGGAPDREDRIRAMEKRMDRFEDSFKALIEALNKRQPEAPKQPEKKASVPYPRIMNLDPNKGASANAGEKFQGSASSSYFRSPMVSAGRTGETKEPAGFYGR